MPRQKKGKFALIGHPPDIDLYREYIRYLKPEKTYRDELIIKLFEWTPAYKISEWNDISLDGKTFTDGIMLMVPFLPEMKDIKLKAVITKVENAIASAAAEGCTVAALGAFTSIVLQGKEDHLSRKYNIKITSGNTFTAALIIKSVEDITARFGVDLKDQTLAIIGASGDIGSGCLVYFGDKVKKMLLTARGIPMLEKIFENHRHTINCEIDISDNNKRAIDNSDIVIFVTSSYKSLFSIDDFSPGTIVCDASAPLNVKVENRFRPDVFLYHGGIASLPFKFETGLDIGLASPNTLYGCLTEGILIAHNEKLPCSIGRGYINRNKIKTYIKQLNDISHLDVSFTVGNKIYNEEEIDNYSKHWHTIKMCYYNN